MATFVLVHGAWHGGWCWSRITPRLRAAGHNVHTPTMTGFGERSHLLTKDVGLETNVVDIMNVLQWEDLGDVILVAPGTYRERIKLKPGLALRSLGSDGKGAHGLKRAETTIIDGAGGPGAHLLNLGHGVMQGTPEEAVGYFVDEAKTYTK